MSETRVIDDKYDGIDWESATHEIAEMHIHPNYPNPVDGDPTPHNIIDAYHDAGYSILSVQPKWNLSEYGDPVHPYPWTELDGTAPDSGESFVEADWTQNRDPKNLGMAAIRSQEVGHVEHLTVWFDEYMRADDKTSHKYYQVGQTRDALHYSSDTHIIQGHPDRYTDPPFSENEWLAYQQLYRDFDRVAGLEVFNARVSDDSRALWDELLQHFGRYRDIIGYAVDDDVFDGGRTVFVFNDGEFETGHEPQVVVDAIIKGRSYFSSVDSGSKDHIGYDSIDHDEENGELTVSTSDPHDRSEWIANGSVIETGDTLDYVAKGGQIGPYVRHQYERDNGSDIEAVCCTQAFRTAPHDMARQEA